MQYYVVTFTHTKIVGLKLRKIHKNFNTTIVGKHWFAQICLGILICAFGVLSLLNPIVLAATLGVFIGLGIISVGANMITLAATPATKEPEKKKA